MRKRHLHIVRWLIFSTFSLTLISHIAIGVICTIQQKKPLELLKKRVTEDFNITKKTYLRKNVVDSKEMIDFVQANMDLFGNDEEKAKLKLLKLIESYNNEKEYVFINDFSGNALLMNGQIPKEKTTIKGKTDIAGLDILEKQLEIIQDQERGFFQCYWDIPGIKDSQKITVFVDQDPEWGWIIGSVTLNSEISKVSKFINNSVDLISKEQIKDIFKVFVIITFFSLMIYYVLAHFLKLEFETLLNFFNNSTDSKTILDTKNLHFPELIAIANSANKMVESRNKIDKDHEELIANLRDALDQIKKMSGLIPICSHCKKIRDDKGFWNNLEKYISEHSEATFSHGICPECLDKYYDDDTDTKKRR